MEIRITATEKNITKLQKMEAAILYARDVTGTMTGTASAIIKRENSIYTLVVVCSSCDDVKVVNRVHYKYGK